MLLIIGIFLYLVYVIVATKALLISPKLRLSIGQAVLIVLFSAPTLPQIFIGRWCYNKWVTITSVLILVISWICVTAG
jgi:hypothetical protein